MAIVGRQEKPRTKISVSAEFAFGGFRASNFHAESCVREPQRPRLQEKNQLGHRPTSGGARDTKRICARYSDLAFYKPG